MGDRLARRMRPSSRPAITKRSVRSMEAMSLTASTVVRMLQRTADPAVLGELIAHDAELDSDRPKRDHCNSS